jgi:hypothetical protein
MPLMSMPVRPSLLSVGGWREKLWIGTGASAGWPKHRHDAAPGMPAGFKLHGKMGMSHSRPDLMVNEHLFIKAGAHIQITHFNRSVWNSCTFSPPWDTDRPGGANGKLVALASDVSVVINPTRHPANRVKSVFPSEA